MKNSPIFALIQGQILKPIPCQPVPAPPHPLLQGMGKLAGVPDDTAFGPMPYDEALGFSSALHDYKTLCIIPCNGLQAIMLEGLALHLVLEQFPCGVPGLTFYPWMEDWNASDGVTRFLLIGYGEPFADIQTEEITASCKPGIAFPLGSVCARPAAVGFGGNRERRDWIPPDMTTLPDLTQLVEFLRTLNLTDKDRADFQTAEILREEEYKREREENNAYWAAKHAAGETVDLGNGFWGLKPDAQETPATRELLP